MSRYDLLLFLHIAGATVWLGGGVMLQALVSRAQATDDETLLKKLAESSAWLAQRIFIPSSLFVLALGIALTIDGPWSVGALWIVLGLVGYAASFLVGILFLEPEGKRIDAAMTAHGAASPLARHHIRRINAVQQAELVILFLVVADMALKPDGDDTGVLVVGGALALAALAYAARAFARPTPSAA